MKLKRIYTAVIAVLFLAAGTVQAKVGTTEFLYTCKCCGKRFKGYVPADLGSFTAEQNEDDSNEDNAIPIKWRKKTYRYIIRTSQSQRLDSDMCYIYSGVNKYNLQIITCPYCGYSLSHNHFSELTPPRLVKEKVHEILRPRMNRLRGMMSGLADRLDVVCHTIIEEQTNGKNGEEKDTADVRKRMVSGYDIQKMIPPYLKYRNAIRCYRWFNFSHSYISRVALNGSWAYRVQLCVPFTTNDPKFTRAYRSVQEILEKRAEKLSSIRDKDAAVLLRNLLLGAAGSGSLSDMERFIVYNMLVDLNDRLGRYNETTSFFSKAESIPHSNPRFTIYMKKKSKWLSYERYFQNVSIDEKKKGLNQNICSRSEVLREIYILGELFKRTGQLNTALNVFRTLYNAPDLDEPSLKHGASEQMKETARILKGQGSEDVPAPDDLALLQNIREGLGTVTYYVNRGIQKKGLPEAVCGHVIKKTGYSIVVFKDKHGYYPDSFEELWEKMSVRERSAVNYFCCPVTGKPYLYHSAKTGYTSWPLVCDPESHMGGDRGKRYRVFWSNGKITEEKAVPGELK